MLKHAKNLSSILVCTLFLSCKLYGDEIFTDDFESGSSNDIWDSYAAGIAELPISSKRTGNALKFFFEGGPDDLDASSEARFDLGSVYSNVTITFELYIPNNYQHRDSSSTDNNKFIRLWQDSYGDIEKVGASLMPSGTGSYIGSDFVKVGNSSISTAISKGEGFISDNDLGKWMSIRIAVKAPNTLSNGSFSVYKNDTLLLTEDKTPNHTDITTGYRYGYLLGWANSGFDADTTLYIDDVIFIDEVVSPPSPPILNAEQTN